MSRWQHTCLPGRTRDASSSLFMPLPKFGYNLLLEAGLIVNMDSSIRRRLITGFAIFRRLPRVGDWCPDLYLQLIRPNTPIYVNSAVWIVESSTIDRRIRQLSTIDPRPRLEPV